MMKKKIWIALFLVQILLFSVFNSNLSYGNPSFFTLSNIPLNGTISPLGCSSINGTTMNERVNSLRTNVCHYHDLKFLNTNFELGCMPTQGIWKDTRNNVTWKFPTSCDEPNYYTIPFLGEFFKPLQQAKLGIPWDQITCRGSFVALGKAPAKHLICVSIDTSQILERRGWIDLHPMIPT